MFPTISSYLLPRCFFFFSESIGTLQSINKLDEEKLDSKTQTGIRGNKT